MATQTLTPPTVDTPPTVGAGEMTELFDGIACLDERVRRQAMPAQPTEAGRYFEVQGTEERLLIT
jgi:hypothetical protein